MTKPYQFTLALALLAVFFLFPQEEKITNAFSIVTILFFGIPHGAVDHKIQISLSRKNNLKRFVLTYVLIATGYLIWWLIMPLKALVIFIILSAYHFGQELVEDHGITGKQPLTYLLWGGTILINPILIHFEEIRFFLMNLSNILIPSLSPSVTWSVVVIIHGLVALDMLRLWWQNAIESKTVGTLTFFSIYLFVSYLVLPFLLAFTLYFILFHSFNAFKHQYRWLKSIQPRYNLKRFIQDLMLFSGVALFGMVLAYLTLEPDNWIDIFSYLFIFISLLTLPHAMVFDQLYNSCRSVPARQV